MKNKTLYFFLSLLVILSVVVNSCKKETQAQLISSLLTQSKWQLASVTVDNNLGTTLISSYTLNTTCDTNQYFIFNSNNTCSYANFECIDQPTATGTWTLSSDQLFLMANMTCKDTLTGSVPSTGKPFAYAEIYTLGEYSMVLETGDIGVYISPTTSTRIVYWGFIRK